MTKYRSVARQYKQAVQDREIRIEREIIDSKNIGSFYKYANRKISTRENVGLLVDDKGNAITYDCGKAKLLNSFFGSVITPDLEISSDIVKRVSSGVFIDTIDFSPMRLNCNQEN